MAAKPQRVPEIDQLRAIAIATVLFVHVSSGFVSRGHIGIPILYADTFMDTLAHYAIPLFTFVSGFSLALGWYEPLDLRAFYAKRAARTLPPYLVFSLLYSIVPLAQGVLSPARALLNLLTGRAEYHLYFFVVIIPLYLLYPVLVRLHKRTLGKVRTVLGAMALTQTIWWAISLAINEQTSLTLLGYTLRGGLLGLIQYGFKRCFIMYLFYFYLGLCCARSWETLRPTLVSWSRRAVQPVALGLFIALLISYIFIVRFGFLKVAMVWAFPIQSVVEVLIYTGSIYLLFMLATQLVARPSVWTAIGIQLSRLSMGIYLVHVPVQRGVDWVLGWLHLIPPTLVAYRYALLITLPATALLVHALSYLPYAQTWLGVTRGRLTLKPPTGATPTGLARG